MLSDPRIGFCGSTLRYYDRPDMVQQYAGNSFNPLKGKGLALGLGRPADEPVEVAATDPELTFVSGASVLVSRALLESVGLMEEVYGAQQAAGVVAILSHQLAVFLSGHLA